MSRGFIKQVRTAISNLNPEDIRRTAERRLSILLQASSEDSYESMLTFLMPSTMSRDRRMAIMDSLARADESAPSGRFHIVFYEYGTPRPDGWDDGRDAFVFTTDRPQLLVRDIMAEREELGLPLARRFPPFRDAVARQTIHAVSRENALFSLMTALPNVIPSLAELPWAIGEFASDTAVLTANQIRMAFLLAAASDREVGFTGQRKEIGSIIAGAWGWRTVARELAGKIPFGGGLIPKAAIAYAGTYVVGLSLDKIYRFGYELTPRERRDAYEAALSKGREVAAHLLPLLKRA